MPAGYGNYYDSHPLTIVGLTAGLLMHSFAIVASILVMLDVAPRAAPDVLVVCPAEFHAALDPWEKYRRSQGHEILVIRPPDTAGNLKNAIQRVASLGRLKYVVLIGDVPQSGTSTERLRSIPTNFIAAKVNTRWGSEASIATDLPYADINGDQAPDLAIGRIPADSVGDVEAVVNKVLRYEQQRDRGPWERRMNLVAGVGGFGKVTDVIVESAARQVIRQTVPAGFEICQTSTNPGSCHCPPPGQFAPHIRHQFSEGCLAWVYMGHSRPTELEPVRRATGEEPTLTVKDAAHLRCGTRSPLAVFVACYTGAIDARRDCLAEELNLAPGGPVAVIAATRVTMPYGNTVLGYELLRATFGDRQPLLGDLLRLAQSRTLVSSTHDTLRASLDAIAQGLSPPPVDLAAERREHVAMYHLFGDPLMRLPPIHDGLAKSPAGKAIVK